MDARDRVPEVSGSKDEQCARSPRPCQKIPSVHFLTLVVGSASCKGLSSAHAISSAIPAQRERLILACWLADFRKLAIICGQGRAV